MTTLSSALLHNASAAPANGWDPSLFAYERPERIEVEVTTPTAQQVAWVGRPPQMRAAGGAIKETTEDVKPRTVRAVDVLHLKFRDADGKIVPALLATPSDKPGPFPVVIAVHGLTSNKAQIVAQLAPTLTKRGFAVLAPDLPCHGERPGDPRSLLDAAKPLKTVELFREVVRVVRMCIDVAEQRPELDTRSGVVLMGYSLGSWVNAVVGPADERVKAMVLMVGGAHDVPLAAVPLPQLRSVDPRMAIAHFAPRPVLLLNGRHDVTVTAEMGRRLFAACDAGSAEQRWYDCGHHLSDHASEEAAEWVEKVISATRGPHKKAG